MSMFDNKGELNASSLKDALGTIAKYASILEENQPANMAMAGEPGFDEQTRNDLISRAMFTQDGKYALAQVMANPKTLSV